MNLRGFPGKGKVMEEIRKDLFFKIDGEYICDLARSWFWDENRPYKKCEDLLLSCLVTDQVTLEEKKRIVIDILEGRKKLIGVNTLDLVEDGKQIRSISEKIEEYRKREMIRKIKDDIYSRPAAYIDAFSCNKDPKEYEPVRNLEYRDRIQVEEAFGKFLTPYHELRLWAYSIENAWYMKSRILPGFWDENNTGILDNGFYLIKHPNLVYEFIGEPENGSNREKLFRLLANHFQSLLERGVLCDSDRQKVIHRNMKYNASISDENSAYDADQDEHLYSSSDELNRNPCSDDYLSEYGLIDPTGNYYSCSFAGHHTKAHYILLHKTGKYFNFDEALDELYNSGWAIIRNPDPAGNVFFDYRADRRPTKRQIDSAFTHMIRFNESTLSGIEKYLD